MEEQLVRTEERVGGWPELAAELGKKKKNRDGGELQEGLGATQLQSPSM